MHYHTIRKTKYTTIIEPLSHYMLILVDGVHVRESATREGLSRRAVSMVSTFAFARA